MFLQNLIWGQMRTDTYGSVPVQVVQRSSRSSKRARAKRPRFEIEIKG